MENEGAGKATANVCKDGNGEDRQTVVADTLLLFSQ
jgi:hypothetical protein